MRLAVLICALLLPHLAVADDRLVRVYAPETLVESGLFKHIIPRFTLKTQVRIELVAEAGTADISLADQGRALFFGLGKTWRMDVQNPAHAGTQKLESWLTSPVGTKTIQGFEIAGTAPFGPPKIVAQEPVVLDMDGDAVLGKQISRVKCGRCHVTETGSGQWGIGSTPSFSVLRSMADWQDRFISFYVLKPHGAFTQITEVTEPFAINRPSPIAPIELTLDEVSAILAYVAVMAKADLGDPLKHQ